MTPMATKEQAYFAGLTGDPKPFGPGLAKAFKLGKAYRTGKLKAFAHKWMNCGCPTCKLKEC